MSEDDIKAMLSKCDGPVAFEEFELFHGTTEKVTDRRLSTNRWNYSICSAILIAIAVIMKWGLENHASGSQINYLYAASFVTIVLCVIATIYCMLWIGQLDDFKGLNKAKYEVLGHMTKNIVYSETENDPRKSFDPFYKEWKIVEYDKGLSELYSSKLVALKSSNIEYMIPRSFMLIFMIVVPACVVFLIYKL